MMYNIEFQFKLLDILKDLNDKNPDYYTVTDVLKQYETTENIEQKYKPILRKRIRNALLKMSIIDRVEKMEEIDQQKKIFMYKFKIKK